MAGLGAPKTGGRQAGTPNKLTRDVRDMILGALADVGGQAYLAQQARDNPNAFLTLVGKAMPQQVERGKPGEFAAFSDQQLEDRIVASMVAKGIPETTARAFVAERRGEDQPHV